MKSILILFLLLHVVNNWSLANVPWLFYYFVRKTRRGKQVDIQIPKSLLRAGFRHFHETAIIIHGFNGTQNSEHIKYLIDGTCLSFNVNLFVSWLNQILDLWGFFPSIAYVHRKYNVIAVDWERGIAYMYIKLIFNPSEYP